MEAAELCWKKFRTARALKVPKGDRSGVVIEPWLTDQWYGFHQARWPSRRFAAVEDGRLFHSCQAIPKTSYFSLDARHPGTVHLASARWEPTAFRPG